MGSENDFYENKSQPGGQEGETVGGRSDIDENKHFDSTAVSNEKAREDKGTHEQDELIVQPHPGKRKGKGRLKQWLTPLAASVIGSVITLTAAPYVSDAYEGNLHNSTEQNQVETSNVDTKPLSADGQSVSDMVEQASKAIVGVVNYQQKQEFGQSSLEKSGTGSGVVYKIKGGYTYIVTNNHVVEDADKLEVSLQDGKTVKANLVGRDPLTDIAMIKVKSKGTDLKTIAFGDSDKVRAGDQVWAIGNPLGLELSRTVTEGIISAADRSIPVSTSAGKWTMDVIQTDAAISPGNSGGALIGTSGQVIGINSMKISDSGSEGLGFAIPSNQVKTIVDQLMKDGQITRPYLGIAVASLDDIPGTYLEQAGIDENAKGVVAVNVEPSSPAGKAGIEQGDLIQSIGNKKISSEAELRKVLYEHSSGDKVKIRYEHNGKGKTATVTLSHTGKNQ
ncbi:trypsin-like peptidase domain-containing protein [Aciduricibacillus chroicocephali]|uniref:Trypsin-like peptidase domain-containing protein n=1 Tax=Aciduricibacillus chroicocephali TaxID=3054939 RepID=A0ABY9KU79_9BACI|nr:trypsin-like peptidase domain-containing protein [Bacillaceae bacterium 44XB]